MRGGETPNTLHNIVSVLRRRRTSYLAQAMALDVDLYRQSLARPQPRGDGAPDLAEFDLGASLLTGIHELLQQITHWVAAAAPEKTKKPRVKRLPRPRTAKQVLARQEARAMYEHIQSVLVFVDQDRFDRTIAAAQEGGD